MQMTRRSIARIAVLITLIAMFALVVQTDRSYSAPIGPAYDIITGAQLTIDVSHHEVHEGEMFHAEYTNASVSDAASVDVLLRTGAKDAHTVFDVYAGGQARVYLYESVTVTTTGTAVTPYNMNRTYSLTPTVGISQTPTVLVGSTVLVNGRVLPGGASQQTRVGGGVRQGVEWILKPDTNYLIRATNTSGSAVPINVVTEWYEE